MKRREKDAAATLGDPRWQKVRARDATADGTFVYSVRSTGVFCRPSCPSRPARPENVRFYEAAEDAIAAGFRPCRRCRPDLPSLQGRNAALVARLCRLLEESEKTPTLQQLARHAGMSAFHVHRIFKAATGVTPKAWAMARRHERARRALGAADSVTDAIYDAGFTSSSRFYEKTDEMLGMTPTRFRRGGDGTRIRFAVGECSLGSLLVAATEHGVCAISLGDDPEALVHELERRFPRAELVGGDESFERLVAMVAGLVERPSLASDLPLDIRGTAFQQRVWSALRRIPAGSTASYEEIAHAIGSPTATRAVAAACASNPLAVAIPCHRVLRKDGGLSGYRWGIERKRALLQRESSDRMTGCDVAPATEQ